LCFFAMAVLVSSLARQKTQAESRAERTVREMAAIVECSDDAIFQYRPRRGDYQLEPRRGAFVRL